MASFKEYFSWSGSYTKLVPELPTEEIVIMKLSKLLSKISYMPPERAVYAQIVSKARQSWLYLEAGVPDTVTGRFDMITLHSFFLMEHLAGNGKKESKFSQKLFDEIFLDMDHSLREMGVGDLSVGKKIRKMSEVFYGACNGYRLALAEPQAQRQQAVADALKRNILGDDVKPENLANLVEYLFKAIKQVEAIPVASVLNGKFDWPDMKLEG